MRVYGVELSFNNRDEVMQFPINPSSIDVSESGQSSSHNVVGLGEINVIKDRKLTEYSFSGLFPAKFYPFMIESNIRSTWRRKVREQKIRSTLSRPVDYIKLIEKWMTQKRPIRFIFNSDSYYINTPASIESFEWSEVAGSGGDIEYSIKLRKYIFYAARKIEPSTTGGITKQQAETRPNEKEQAKTYKLVAGDSLWSVAKKQLGDGARWKEIQTLNGITDTEITRLQIGRVLKLP